MASTRFFKGWMGPFKLLRRCGSVHPGHDEVGRLYEASHLLSGNPSLVLIPSEHAPMEPQEEWRVRLRSQAHPPLLSLEVEQAPDAGRLSQLRGMLALLASSVECLGSDDGARAHLTVRPLGFLQSFWHEVVDIYRWVVTSIWHTLLTFAVGLVSFLGAYLGPIHCGDAGRQTAHGVAVQAVAESRAPALVQTTEPNAAPIAYPLPAKPFSDQARAPCYPKQGEVEINGGCWVTLEKRPPCFDIQAEYQGKCYLPVSANRRKAREPQSVHP